MTLPDGGKVIGCDISNEWVDIGKPFFSEVTIFRNSTFNLSLSCDFMAIIKLAHQNLAL